MTPPLPLPNSPDGLRGIGEGGPSPESFVKGLGGVHKEILP
jgi:hypothetical protein